MMYNEFCEISGQEVSFKAYSEKFEPMYMALGMDKREFINFLMPTIKEVAKQRNERTRSSYSSLMALKPRTVPTSSEDSSNLWAATLRRGRSLSAT